ncbi:hypothetical protein A3I34_00315 [Candidatus Jorgensenbacteria bacterium RIFCSPLOWO2_02_FULL_45_12]|uniref:Uncharacterized protein n=1 Tax=Candidatus Jorgensenbacteria bacterium RIFCSPHIGHO2_02_FULL_45_20 TaxID=1798470 RepID=A0A1F6BPR7_9BACT|nr:MAG: hypothetical protein A3D55_03165 [Candidatus Jorgensenbacteria bacterium RIFCSPHIGHO2_02_FULL_45_20]OGG42369.1 MAG: hypothetical protein A3I34_00315 [Candidatus Jorgensenbacteria bacterium RIFCSPLOWO2_02_FULL_45_12]
MKGSYKILLFLAVLIVGMFILFFFINRMSIPTPSDYSGGVLPEPTNSENKNEPGALPNEALLITTVKISDRPVFDFWINKKTGETYYISSEGNVFSAKNNEDINLNTQAIESLNFIVPSPSGERILAALGNPQSPRWGVFDVVDLVWRPMPETADILAWGATDDSLVGILTDKENTNLVYVDISNAVPKISVVLSDFYLNDIRLYGGISSSILIAERPGFFYKSRVWEINFKSGAIKTINSGENGLTLSFNDKKTVALKFSAQNGASITDALLKTIMPLTFVTLPEKCGFGSDIIYCFVPNDQELFKKNSLPDDYVENKFFSTDNLIKIYPDTDGVSVVAKSGDAGFGVFDGIHPAVSGDGVIYFINKYDKFLYKTVIEEPGISKQNPAP